MICFSHTQKEGEGGAFAANHHLKILALPNGFVPVKYKIELYALLTSFPCCMSRLLVFLLHMKLKKKKKKTNCSTWILRKLVKSTLWSIVLEW